jgi:hypothetical protein
MAAAETGQVRTPRRIAGREGRAERGGRLPPEAVVTFAAERKAAAIDDVFAALDRELVGLVPVKKRVQEIGSLLLVDRVRQRFGLTSCAGLNKPSSRPYRGWPSPSSAWASRSRSVAVIWCACSGVSRSPRSTGT